jgi:RND family efflux transporter MFP subunit
LKAARFPGVEDLTDSPYNGLRMLPLGKEPNIETGPNDLSRLKIDWKKEQATSRPRRRLGKGGWILLVALLAVVAAAMLYRLFLGSPQTVEVGTVSSILPSQSTTILNASGYVVAQRRAAVASKATGRLIELKVKEGSRVKKGEILARLESADVEAAFERAEANLNVARSSKAQAEAELNEATLSYERRKDLLASDLIPKADFDAAEARYRRARAVVDSAEAGMRAAEAAVRGARVEVESTYIRAPFDGTVLTKNAEIGEVVAPFGSATSAKAAVVTMADMASLQVEADVSESNIEKVRVGQRSEISLDAYPNIKYEGTVETIVPTADRAKATVMTKIRFLNRDDRVFPEMGAKVAFLSEPQQEGGTAKIAAPSGAIVTRENRKVAFLVRGDKVEERPVEVGGPVGAGVEIKKGLSPGDRVVLNPPEGLNAGDKIEIQTK